MRRLPTLLMPLLALAFVYTSIDVQRARLDGWMALSLVTMGSVILAAMELWEPKAPRMSWFDVGDRGLWTMVCGYGAIVMVGWRTVLGVAANELQLFAEAGLPWWRLPFIDVGLPSLVHGLLTALASEVGGVALILVVHALLYLPLVALWRSTLSSLADRLTSWTLLAALSAAPVLLYQVTELRSYVTFLLAGAVALRAVPVRPDIAAIALLVGALDAPSCLLLAAGLFLHRLTSLPRPHPGTVLLGGLRKGSPQDRWWRAGLVLAAGLLPWLAAVRGMHTDPGDLQLLADPALLAALLVACVALLVPSGAPAALRMSAATGLLGALALIGGGGLAGESRYLLFAAPWLAATLGAALRGRVPDSLTALTLAGGVAGAWLGAAWAPDAIWVWAGGAVAGAGLGMVWRRPPIALPVLVILSASAAWMQRQVVIEQADRALRETALAEATAIARDGAICAMEMPVGTWLRAAVLTGERPGLWTPLRRVDPRTLEQRVQVPCEPDARAVVVSDETRVPPGCNVASARGWIVARCDAAPSPSP